MSIFRYLEGVTESDDTRKEEPDEFTKMLASAQKISLEDGKIIFTMPDGSKVNMTGMFKKNH